MTYRLAQYQIEFNKSLEHRLNSRLPLERKGNSVMNDKKYFMHNQRGQNLKIVQVGSFSDKILANIWWLPTGFWIICD